MSVTWMRSGLLWCLGLICGRGLGRGRGAGPTLGWGSILGCEVGDEGDHCVVTSPWGDRGESWGLSWIPGYLAHRGPPGTRATHWPLYKQMGNLNIWWEKVDCVNVTFLVDLQEEMTFTPTLTYSHVIVYKMTFAISSNEILTLIRKFVTFSCKDIPCLVVCLSLYHQALFCNCRSQH